MAIGQTGLAAGKSKENVVRSNIVDAAVKPAKKEDSEKVIRLASYISQDESLTHEPCGETIGVIFHLKDQKSKEIIRTETVKFADLPTHMLVALAAFGLNTAGTNAWNSAQVSGNSDQRFDERLSAFRAGLWSNRGTGETKERAPKVKPTPLIVQAIIRDGKAQGKTTPSNKFEDWDHFEAVYRGHWESWDRKQRDEFYKKWIAVKGVNKAYTKIKDELEKAKLAKLEKVETVGSLDDL